jgi:hypothetical protein
MHFCGHCVTDLLAIIPLVNDIRDFMLVNAWRFVLWR